MEFSNPQTILQNVTLGQGATVVDLGAGSGFYSLAAARIVGREGRVFAVDVQKDLLDRLYHAAQSEGLHHLEVVWGDIEHYGGSKLREGSADVVLLCNTLFQLENKQVAVDEAMRLLRNGGRLIAVDWNGSHFGMGPEEHLVFSQEQATALFTDTGLSVETSFDAGQQHWGLVLRKK